MKKTSMIELTQKLKLSVTISNIFDMRLNLDNIIEKESILSKKPYAIATNDWLDTSKEQLECSNERLESSNERLEPTNDWLDSSNEWLESSNDWLEPTNDWLEPTNEYVSTSKIQNNNMLYKLTLLNNL